MTKLFTKILTTSVAAFSAICVSACSDKIAGTAEEPNQFAFGNGSSSNETENNVSLNSSSSASPAPITILSSSSEPDQYDNRPSTPPSSSSENKAGSEGLDPQPGVIGYPDQDPISTLDSYLEKYGVTEVTYDENVLAYNKTFEGCDAAVRSCAESPDIAKLKTLGLHKITQEDITTLRNLFPKTVSILNGRIYEKDGVISRVQGGCQLYILNTSDTSPAIHVLTKIEKDTITITEIHDNCDYEPRPFDMHVGFLFEYCGELSESPKIDIHFKQNNDTNCTDVDYDEHISIKLLR